MMNLQKEQNDELQKLKKHAVFASSCTKTKLK